MLSSDQYLWRTTATLDLAEGGVACDVEKSYLRSGKAISQRNAVLTLHLSSVGNKRGT